MVTVNGDNWGHLTADVGDKRHKFDSQLGRPPGGGHGNPLQYFLPGNSHGQRSLGATIHSVTESDTTEVTGQSPAPSPPY